MTTRVLSIALAACLTAFAAHAEDAAKFDCENTSVTAEMNVCADALLAKADADLNATYQKALAAVPEMASEKPYDTKSWEAALRASQRAWLAYRDAECKNHVAMFWTGGSGATVDILGCMTDMTTARTKELRARYEDGEAAPAP